MQATLARSLTQLDTDVDHDSALRTFENETLVMALGLLGALVADREQVHSPDVVVDMSVMSLWCARTLAFVLYIVSYQ